MCVGGYDQSDNDMREVDVPMMQSAFETKESQVCIPFEAIVESEDSKDRYIHLDLGVDGKAKQIACSLSKCKRCYPYPGKYAVEGI